MANEKPVSRRTVLQTLGGVATVALGVSTVAASTGTDTAASAETTETATTARTGRPLAATSSTARDPQFGLYSGTVDRIVDGEHVVVLLEADGRVVGQEVLDSDRYPWLGEGDSVHVFLFMGTVLTVV